MPRFNVPHSSPHSGPQADSAPQRSRDTALTLPRLLIPLVVLVTLLAGCGEKPDADPGADKDPAVAGALGEEIMVDPDLARQNPHNAALGGGGPASAPVPPVDKRPEAVAAAKAEVARLVGGPLQSAPEPQPQPASGTGSGAGHTAAQTATIALGKHAGKDCAARVEYTAAWAARMPGAFPVYPRGNVQEAAGTDADGCRLRVVSFVTPVPLGDVADFYWTRARTGGFTAHYRVDGADRVIDGNKGGAAYVVYLRSANGLTEVDLVTNGQ